MKNSKWLDLSLYILGTLLFSVIAIVSYNNSSVHTPSVYAQGIDCYVSQIFLSNVVSNQVPPTATPVQQIWEEEPNDIPGEATGPIRADINYYGYPNDRSDYFYFDLATTGQISITLEDLAGSGDRQLILYYQSQDNLVTNDSNEPFQIVRSNRQPGRYFVRIYVESNHNTTTPYILRVSYPVAFAETASSNSLPECTPTHTPVSSTDGTSTPTLTPTSVNDTTPTPTATTTVEGQSQGYDITTFYTPSGWMLNGENPAKFVFDPGYSGNCHINATCYKISWQPELVDWVGLYWLHPDADGAGGNWPQLGQPGCNFSGATKVTFWARGEKGGEIVAFESAFYADQKVESGPIPLTQDWKEYNMDIRSADLTNIVGAFAWYIFKASNPNETIFYLDNIRYQGVEPNNVTCMQPPTPTSTATPKPTSQYGYNFESGTQNWTTSEGSFKPITLTTTTQVVYSGSQAVQLNPNLRGDDADIYHHTEAVAYFNNAIPEGLTSSGPYNLDGKLVSCYVFLPSELTSAGNAQAYIRLFVKDKDFRNQFSNALDIASSTVNRWLQLSLTVGTGGNQEPGFKITEVNALGIRIELHNGATLVYTGPIYIDHCAIQQP